MSVGAPRIPASHKSGYQAEDSACRSVLEKLLNLTYGWLFIIYTPPPASAVSSLWVAGAGHGARRGRIRLDLAV